MQSLNDEREGALWKEGAETTHQESMRAGKAQGAEPPVPRSGCPPPILTLHGDWMPLGKARDGTGRDGYVPPPPASPPTYGPGEAEGEADGIAEGGVGAARTVGDAEGVGAEDGGDGGAVGAGRLGGHAGLVVLEADAEEGLAVALLEPAGAGAAPAAAVAVAEQPLLIDKLLQLQLEDPGGADLQGGDRGRQPAEQPAPQPDPDPGGTGTPSTLLSCNRQRQSPASPAGLPGAGTPRCRHSCPPRRGHLPGSGSAAPRGRRASAGTDLPFWRCSSGALAFLSLIFSSEGKGESVSRGKGKNTAAKAARPSRAGRVSVTVSFFQECL